VKKRLQYSREATVFGIHKISVAAASKVVVCCSHIFQSAFTVSIFQAKLWKNIKKIIYSKVEENKMKMQ
jgi:hypothetical protein